MKVEIGAPVFSSDRKQVGKVSRVVIDPQTNRVVDLIVHRHTGLLETRDQVIPITAVSRAAEDEVALRLDERSVDQLPDLVDSDYLPPSPGWFTPAPYPPGGVLWPAAVAAPGVIEHENLPEGTVTLTKGTIVVCSDGPIGRVDEVTTDPDTGEVSGFIVRRGTIFTHDVFVPLDWVGDVTSEKVTLNRTKAEIQKLKERGVS